MKSKNFQGVIRKLAEAIKISHSFGTLYVAPNAVKPAVAVVRDTLGVTQSYAQRMLDSHAVTYVGHDNLSAYSFYAYSTTSAPSNTQGFKTTWTAVAGDTLDTWEQRLSAFVVEGSLADARIGDFQATGEWDNSTSPCGDMFMISIRPTGQSLSAPGAGTPIRAYDGTKFKIKLPGLRYANTFDVPTSTFSSGMLAVGDGGAGTTVRYARVAYDPNAQYSTLKTQQDIAAFLSARFVPGTFHCINGSFVRAGMFGCPIGLGLYNRQGNWHYVVDMARAKQGLELIASDGLRPTLPADISTMSGVGVVSVTPNPIPPPEDCFKEWSKYRGEDEFENARVFETSNDLRPLKDIRSAVAKLSKRNVFGRALSDANTTVYGTLTVSVTAGVLTWLYNGSAVGTGEDALTNALEKRAEGAMFNATAAYNLVAASTAGQSAQADMNDEIRQVDEVIQPFVRLETALAYDTRKPETSWLYCCAANDSTKVGEQLGKLAALYSASEFGYVP